LTGAFHRLRKTVAWDALTVAATASIFAVLSRFGHFYFLLPLLIGLLYAGFFLGKLSNSIIRMRWIVITGGMCYTIYLYHILIMSNAMSKTMQLASLSRAFNLDFALQCLMVLPVVFAVCAWLFIYTEKPFMRWSLSPRRAQPATQAAAAD
jgi:peptidoglycan/LPS O-acetylase OafA/YrhL